MLGREDMYLFAYFFLYFNTISFANGGLKLDSLIASGNKYRFILDAVSSSFRMEFMNWRFDEVLLVDLP